MPDVSQRKNKNKQFTDGTVNHTPILLELTELKRHRCESTEGEDHWGGWKTRSVSILAQPAWTGDTQNTKSRKMPRNSKLIDKFTTYC